MERRRTLIVKWLKWIAITAGLFFVLARICYALTDDFRLANIACPIPYEKSWKIAALSPKDERLLEQILNQPFTYLGKGAQAYVFASQDNQYVLKFFKFKHLHPSFFIKALPAVGSFKTYKEKQIARKERKLMGVFKSYKLAYDANRSESGLVFIQLNTEDSPQRLVTITDKLGIKRTIDLQNYPFIVQHKGKMLRVVVDELLKKQDVKMAKKRFGQILDLYAREYRKGIFDHDHGVMRNTGFIGDDPIHLDVGKLVIEEEMRDKKNARKDAELVVNKINFWMKKHYPQYSEEMASYLSQEMEQLY